MENDKGNQVTKLIGNGMEKNTAFNELLGVFKWQFLKYKISEYLDYWKAEVNMYVYYTKLVPRFAIFVMILLWINRMQFQREFQHFNQSPTFWHFSTTAQWWEVKIALLLYISQTLRP